MKQLKKPKTKKPVTVVASGGFDPIHIGHIRLFNEARKLGDKLIVLINNDHWLKQKKGYVFMPQNERKEIIENIRSVDKVIFTSHKPHPQDMGVGKDLLRLKPDVFAQGGDRKSDADIPPTEVAAYRKLGCKVVYNVGFGGKVQSSSWLSTNFIAQALKNDLCPCKSGKKFSACGLKNTAEHKKYLNKMLNR